MKQHDYQRVIDELQRVIEDTRQTIDRFEAAGMDERMPEDYRQLLEILDRAVKDQRAHTLAMLDKPEPPEA